MGESYTFHMSLVEYNVVTCGKHAKVHTMPWNCTCEVQSKYTLDIWHHMVNIWQKNDSCEKNNYENETICAMCEKEKNNNDALNIKNIWS